MLEISAVILTLIAVFIAGDRSRHYWSIGGVASVLYGIVFWQTNLLFSAALQIFYILISIQGFFHWSDKEKVDASIRTPISDAGHLIIILISIGFGVLLSFAFPQALQGISDGALAALSVTATVLNFRGDSRSWLYWVFIDAFYVVNYALPGLYPTAGLYLVLAIIAYRNFILWHKVQLEPKPL